DPILAPCYAPESHMVYVAGRENVSHVWVAGNLMLENHTLTGFFKNDLEKLVSLWQTRVSPCTGRT
ncbi:MAG: 5-methylthioadenosine/S-adenosylhomocysteine deaminase, partial [Pseudomonadota bacterium]|nr:5-methylthioadenosine/S-adenosylhomocysteine deaminase [Pseudomonadota bacterium]